MELLSDKHFRNTGRWYKLAKFLSVFGIDILDLATDAKIKRDEAAKWQNNDEVIVLSDPVKREVLVVEIKAVLATIKYDEFYFIQSDDLDKEGR